MKEPTRYAISSPEEVWVRACSKFFEKHGTWDWFTVPKNVAFVEIMENTRGQGNLADIKQRVENLYKSAGVREL